MQYNESQIELLELLGHEEDVCLMVAPSFVVDFDYKKFVPLMKALGFDYVTEVTFGAKIVNQEYHKYISENKEKQEKFIASVCPMIVNLLKAQRPELIPSLLPVVSPMIAMAKILRKQYPKNKIVFLSPCNAKKIEAKNSGLIDCVVTFKEMKEIISKEKIKPKKTSHLFDSFYNDYTKIYPLSGGLSKTLHAKDILKKEELFSKDNCKSMSCLNGKEKFFDLLFCDGGCIGGNGVSSKLPSFMKKYSVLGYRKQAKKEKIGEHKGLEKYTRGIDFKKKF
jgi:iron only hydrogenase large subunit-like protein